MSGLFILCLCAYAVMSSAMINPYSYGYGRSGYPGGIGRGFIKGGGMIGGGMIGGGFIKGGGMIGGGMIGGKRMRYRRSIGMPIYGGYPRYGTYGGYKGSYYY